MPPESELIIHGKRIKVSNLAKVLYPKSGFTKGQVLDYYTRISTQLLPHLKDRPLTLKRYPNGVEAEFFYEKRCPSFRPDWVQTTPIWSQGKQTYIKYCMMNDLASLVWAANLANLELHTSLALSRDAGRPTVMVFDLDPGLPAGILDCVQVALWLREILTRIKLSSFPKTTGSKGLQVYVPLNTRVTFDKTKAFAKSVAELLARKHPNEVVYKMPKALRRGKVFVDWSQNDDHKTTVCVYSLRARETPTVSTPVTWEEAEWAVKKKNPAHLVFDPQQVLARVEKHGDLFAPILKMKQRLQQIEL